MNDETKFHSSEKGCEIIEHQSLNEERSHKIIKDKYCNSHQVTICKCGWEWGWHYGNYDS